MKGIIFDIQRFSVHDGPGIRTTVFMKGCPLSCPWCHNPEGLSGKMGVQYFKEKCIGCNLCLGEKTLERVKSCPTGALSVSGVEIDADSLMTEVLKDREFYSLDGGVTFSGGECLSQAEFVSEMLKRIKEKGITTAVDTSGYVPFESIEKTLEYTDIYLYDVKSIDESLHKKYVGKDNKLILDNLKKLSERGRI